MILYDDPMAKFLSFIFLLLAWVLILAVHQDDTATVTISTDGVDRDWYVLIDGEQQEIQSYHTDSLILVIDNPPADYVELTLCSHRIGTDDLCMSTSKKLIDELSIQIQEFK